MRSISGEGRRERAAAALVLSTLVSVCSAVASAGGPAGGGSKGSGAPSTTATATATPAAAPTAAATTGSAAELFQKGSDLYAAGKWPDALAAFKEAWALQKTYDIAANLGHTEVKLERWRDAAEHLAFAVKNWPVVGKPEPRELAKQRLSEARAKVAAVSIEVNVVGAEVLVDGKVLGKAPLDGEVFVEPGAHRVEAKTAGYKGEAVGVQGTAGGSHAVKVVLVREDVETPGGGGWKTERKAIAIGGGVAAAALLGVGVGFKVAANGKQSDASALIEELKLNTASGAPICDPATTNTSPKCSELRDVLSDTETFNHVSLGTLIAGGVVAGATAGFVIWSVLRAPKATASSAIVMPALNASSAGAVVVGRW